MEPGDYVAASGGLLFVWSLGSTISPAAAGVLMGRVGAVGLFLYLAAVVVALGVFTATRMVQRDEVPRERRSAFVPATSAPPRHAELVSGVVAALRYPGATDSVWRTLLRDANQASRD
jgi:hypothetical protein